jgi:hypothetical protein
MSCLVRSSSNTCRFSNLPGCSAYVLDIRLIALIQLTTTTSLIFYIFDR